MQCHHHSLHLGYSHPTHTLPLLSSSPLLPLLLLLLITAMTPDDERECCDVKLSTTRRSRGGVARHYSPMHTVHYSCFQMVQSLLSAHLRHLGGHAVYPNLLFVTSQNGGDTLVCGTEGRSVETVWLWLLRVLV